MPNWVRNEMQIRGTDAQVQEVLESIRSKEYDGAIDFDRIIPKPECIKKTPNSGREAREAETYYRQLTAQGKDPIAVFRNGYRTGEMALQETSWESWREKDGVNSPDYPFGDTRHKVSYEELMLNYLTCMKETGCVDWYDWCCEHWGTKWNACEPTADGAFVTFDTAWSAPRPIFMALAKQFPEVTFSVTSTNEDYAIPVTVYEYRYDPEKKEVEETLVEEYEQEYPDDDYED